MWSCVPGQGGSLQDPRPAQNWDGLGLWKVHEIKVGAGNSLVNLAVPSKAPKPILLLKPSKPLHLLFLPLGVPFLSSFFDSLLVCFYSAFGYFSKSQRDHQSPVTDSLFWRDRLSPQVQMTSATLTTAHGNCHFTSPIPHGTVSPWEQRTLQGELELGLAVELLRKARGSNSCSLLLLPSGQPRITWLCPKFISPLIDRIEYDLQEKITK